MKQEHIVHGLQRCHLVLVTTVVLEIDHLYVLHIFVVHLELQAPTLDQPQSWPRHQKQATTRCKNWLHSIAGNGMRTWLDYFFLKKKKRREHSPWSPTATIVSLLSGHRTSGKTFDLHSLSFSPMRTPNEFNLPKVDDHNPYTICLQCVLWAATRRCRYSRSPIASKEATLKLQHQHYAIIIRYSSILIEAFTPIIGHTSLVRMAVGHSALKCIPENLATCMHHYSPRTWPLGPQMHYSRSWGMMISSILAWLHWKHPRTRKSVLPQWTGRGRSGLVHE